MTTEMVYPGLQKIIDVLKNLDNSPTSQLGFDMSLPYPIAETTRHPCGTACCIGGFAQKILNTELATISALAKLCDCCHSVSEDLCYPRSVCRHIYNWSDISLEWAIAVLEHCRDTGEVDWEKFEPKEETDVV